MSRTTALPVLAANDQKAIDEVAALPPSRWPVDALVLYGSKARSDDWSRGVYQAAPIRKEIDAEGVDIALPMPSERR